MTITKACVAELIGTFALCLVGGGSIMASAIMGAEGGGIVAIALAHGLILSIVVTASMNVSGGHINPAVTIAMMIVGRCSPGRATAYIIAQVIGGLLAGYMLGAVMFKNTSTPEGVDVVAKTKCGTPTINVVALNEIESPPAVAIMPTESSQAGSQPTTSEAEVAIHVPPLRPTAEQRWSAAKRAAVIEAVITFLLVFAIFGTAVDPRHPNVGGFGIGLTVAANIFLAGPLTGAAMNPARVLGTGFMSEPEFWETAWLAYGVGPVAGAVFGAIVYHFLVLDREAGKD